MEKTIVPESASPAPDPRTGNKKRKPHPFWRVFWLSFLIVGLIYAWYSFYVPSNEVVWAEDFASAKQLASESGKPMLLFFTAEWCVPCRIMKREVFADKDVMRAINAKLVPLMIYEDDPGGDELFKRYNIEGTPITVVTDSEGKVINYAVGGIGKSEFLRLISDQ